MKKLSIFSKTLVICACAINFYFDAAEWIESPVYKSNNAQLELDRVKLDHSLFEALEDRDVAKVELLLAAGANPNVEDSEGETPLMYAVDKYHRIKFVKLLLSAGANPNAKSKIGNTPLMSAVRVFGPVGKSRTAMVVKMLLAAGADPNETNSFGGSPLRSGIFSNNPAAIKELLLGGANPNSADDKGFTPLMTVSIYEDPEMAALLLAAGADPNSVDSVNVTPLLMAAYNGDLEKVKMLVDAGANTFNVRSSKNVGNKELRGKTALDVAIERRHKDMAQYLSQVTYELEQLKNAIQQFKPRSLQTNLLVQLVNAREQLEEIKKNEQPENYSARTKAQLRTFQEALDNLPAPLREAFDLATKYPKQFQQYLGEFVQS